MARLWISIGLLPNIQEDSPATQSSLLRLSRVARSESCTGKVHVEMWVAHAFTPRAPLPMSQKGNWTYILVSLLHSQQAMPKVKYLVHFSLLTLLTLSISDGNVPSSVSVRLGSNTLLLLLSPLHFRPPLPNSFFFSISIFS
jgi:hypothetical protein